MVKYQRKNPYTQWKKSREQHMVDEDEELGLDPLGLICGNSAHANKRASPKFLCFVFLSLLSCTLILSPLFLPSDSNFLLCKFVFV